jgi:CRP-like cAMP-binding protein
MGANYIKLYTASSPVKSAFFLVDGVVYFYASNADKYSINGKNLVLGATEIILKHMADINTGRLETAVTDSTSRIKKMPVEKFMEGMNSPSFIINVSMVLARQVKLTNRIANTNLDSLEGDDRKTKEYSLKYFRIVQRLQNEYEKRKLPWLKEIIKDSSLNLTFKRGEAFFKSSEPAVISSEAVKRSERDVEYSPGTIICEENTPGTEMYILKSGAIDVLDKGARVTCIVESGTIIGEMALLLGEKRTATLKARNNVVLMRIKKDDLKDIVEKERHIITGLASTLARRHHENVNRIAKINRSLAEQMIEAEMGGVKKIQHAERTLKDLNVLTDNVEAMIRQRDADYLKSVLE